MLNTEWASFGTLQIGKECGTGLHGWSRDVDLGPVLFQYGAPAKTRDRNGSKNALPVGIAFGREFGLAMGVVMRRWVWMGVLLMGVGAAGSPGRAGGSRDAGLLIMAHGGDEPWNRAVKEAVAPLEKVCPVVVAYGMAQREPLRRGIRQLEEQGVRKIAVVRLFMDGRSFLSQTEYLLGVSDQPPPFFLHHDHHHHKMTRDAVRLLRGSEIPPPIDVESQVILSDAGLLDSRLAGDVLLDRVRALSESPPGESVLVIGHGVGSDARDRYWKDRMQSLARGLKVLGPFREVRVETLREDWEDKRRLAEERIRSFVSKQSRQGRVLVVPFRVFGFGPYDEVLEGLDYSADRKGLLPHPNVTEWLREQAQDCFSRAGWASPFPSIHSANSCCSGSALAQTPSSVR